MLSGSILCIHGSSMEHIVYSREHNVASKFNEVSKFWFTLHDLGKKV